jgi:hypothetical protein
LPANFSDYLQTPVTVSGTSVSTPYVGVWVRLVSNTSGLAYISTAATNANGLFTIIQVPADVYTVYTGPTSSGAWTGTGDANYIVPALEGTDGIWSVTDFGAKGDLRWFSDANITTGTAILTSATANFSAADVGKTVAINGAAPPSTSGNVLTTTVASFQSTTQVTLAANATQTATNTNACIGTDNNTPIQAAINAQQSYGGRVKVPLDSAGGKYLCAPGLIGAPGSQAGGFTTATRPLLIEGDGMLNSVIVAGAPNTFNGLFGQVNVIQAQMIMSDLTLDGNYLGVASGALPQPSGLAGALLALPPPFTNAFAAPNPQVPTGQYHVLSRVRFYRAPGFTCQQSQGLRLADCVFDQVGQPDVASGGLHWDNLGSAQGDVVAIGCSWKDSSGNYADFTNTGTGTISRLIMIGCESVRHQIGGVYALGIGSIIAFNRLSNSNASSIAYDSSGPTANRSKNIIVGNILDNITVNPAAAPASFALYGDIVYGNIGPDASVGAGTTFYAPLDLQQVGGNVNSPAASGLQAVNGDKILFMPGSGAGQRTGIGTASGALAMVLPNAAGQRFRIMLDPGGTAAMSSGTGEIWAFTTGNHMIIANSSAPASSNRGANVTSVTMTGNDTIGKIVVVMAGALAANTRIATITFNQTYSANAPNIVLTNNTSGAGLASVDPYVQATSTGVSFDLACNQALATGTYTFGYIVIGQTAGGN